MRPDPSGTRPNPTALTFTRRTPADLGAPRREILGDRRGVLTVHPSLQGDAQAPEKGDIGDAGHRWPWLEGQQALLGQQYKIAMLSMAEQQATHIERYNPDGPEPSSRILLR